MFYSKLINITELCLCVIGCCYCDRQLEEAHGLSGQVEREVLWGWSVTSERSGAHITKSQVTALLSLEDRLHTDTLIAAVTLTLINDLDLDIVKMYLHTKSEVSRWS